MNTIDNKHIGADKAKTHLSDLLDRVEHGEELVITRQSNPMARLVPAELGHDVAKAKAAVRELITIREEIRARSGNFTLEKLLSARDEGRRY